MVTEIDALMPSDVHLMTSRELTSGFEFWSCGHMRMAVLHLLVKFDADIFIQSGVIDIFPKFKMAVQISNFTLSTHRNGQIHTLKIQDAGYRHLGFSDYVNLAIRVC